MHLQVEHLDKQIRRLLVERIISGVIPSNANVNEVRLAAELGVSRTPLRHALVRLEEEGFVYTEPNRGFFVVPLTLEEARELYPILSSLECLALAMSPPDRAAIDELERLNRGLAEVDPDDPGAAVSANRRWHERLVASNRNARLARLLDGLWQQVHRYEISFFAPGAERLRKSVALHASITSALEATDVQLACARLHDHWMTDLEELAPS